MMSTLLESLAEFSDEDLDGYEPSYGRGGSTFLEMEILADVYYRMTDGYEDIDNSVWPNMTRFANL